MWPYSCFACWGYLLILEESPWKLDLLLPLSFLSFFLTGNTTGLIANTFRNPTKAKIKPTSKFIYQAVSGGESGNNRTRSFFLDMSSDEISSSRVASWLLRSVVLKDGGKEWKKSQSARLMVSKGWFLGMLGQFNKEKSRNQRKQRN